MGLEVVLIHRIAVWFLISLHKILKTVPDVILSVWYLLAALNITIIC